jgi:hypothetical protein
MSSNRVDGVLRVERLRGLYDRGGRLIRGFAPRDRIERASGGVGKSFFDDERQAIGATTRSNTCRRSETPSPRSMAWSGPTPCESSTGAPSARPLMSNDAESLRQSPCRSSLAPIPSKSRRVGKHLF